MFASAQNCTSDDPAFASAFSPYPGVTFFWT
jgi:hypothetical protein